MVDAADVPQIRTEVKEKETTGTNKTVPPPPPPPPPLPILENKTEVPTSVKGAKPKTETVDVRSELMAAIRSAGKGNLRSANDRIYEAKKKKLENTNNAEGMDMMADLKSTLAMRRRVRCIILLAMECKEYVTIRSSLTVFPLFLGYFWFIRRT